VTFHSGLSLNKNLYINALTNQSLKLIHRQVVVKGTNITKTGIFSRVLILNSLS